MAVASPSTTASSGPMRALEFLPPPTPGIWRSLGLALLAHAVLVAGLSWGVAWRRQADLTVTNVELWAQVPQEAAPPPSAPPPVALPEPAKPVPPAPVKADIVTERRPKEEPNDKAKTELADKLAKEKASAEAAKRREAAELAAQQKQREENLRRMMASAESNPSTGAATSPSPNSAGAAAQSAGPSASYAGRIRARIKPNIVFTDLVAGNPLAEIEVQTSPDGTIVKKRLVKSSGTPAWDEAVLKAIEKTETLPRDVDGRVPPLLVIGFRPKDL